MFTGIITGVAGLYLLLLGTMMKTEDFQSMIYLKFIPVVLGVLLLTLCINTFRWI